MLASAVNKAIARGKGKGKGEKGKGKGKGKNKGKDGQPRPMPDREIEGEFLKELIASQSDMEPEDFVCLGPRGVTAMGFVPGLLYAPIPQEDPPIQFLADKGFEGKKGCIIWNPPFRTVCELNEHLVAQDKLHYELIFLVHLIYSLPSPSHMVSGTSLWRLTVESEPSPVGAGMEGSGILCVSYCLGKKVYDTPMTPCPANQVGRILSHVLLGNRKIPAVQVLHGPSIKHPDHTSVIPGREDNGSVSDAHIKNIPGKKVRGNVIIYEDPTLVSVTPVERQPIINPKRIIMSRINTKGEGNSDGDFLPSVEIWNQREVTYDVRHSDIVPGAKSVKKEKVHPRRGQDQKKKSDKNKKHKKVEESSYNTEVWVDGDEDLVGLERVLELMDKAKGIMKRMENDKDKPCAFTEIEFSTGLSNGDEWTNDKRLYTLKVSAKIEQRGDTITDPKFILTKVIKMALGLNYKEVIIGHVGLSCSHLLSNRKGCGRQGRDAAKVICKRGKAFFQKKGGPLA